MCVFASVKHSAEAQSLIGSYTHKKMAANPGYKKRVSYYYDDRLAYFNFGKSHPMKPIRLGMTHRLLRGYHLLDKMEVCRPMPSKESDLTRFHSKDYVKFLNTVMPENKQDSHIKPSLKLYQLHNDCPVFSGLYDFCALSAGGSIASAVKLNHKKADICINWSGGLHHAKKSEASGFCYVNDIVLAILELLKYHARVLYIDIDVHHGDGVEEAFYTTDRVMTVSFHKFDPASFFPGTGAVTETGAEDGKNYSLNFPLHDGMDDASYEAIFKPVISKVMESYRPEAVVLQCGADSLAHDRLGVFNMTLSGHGMCVEFMTSFHLPLMLLGGGGYHTKNVARCWTYETSIACGVELDNALPYTDYFEYFAPYYKLHFAPSDYRPNHNTPHYLQRVKNKLFQILKEINHAPSVQMQVIPDDFFTLESTEDVEAEPDVRVSEADRDRRVAHTSEFWDSEDDQEEPPRTVHAVKGKLRGRRLLDQKRNQLESMDETNSQ